MRRSNLASLRNRKDASGHPLISDEAFKAGEGLRSDYTIGNLMPSIGANWDVTGSGSRANGVLEITDAALVARQRVERALEAVAPELSGVLIDVCCFLKGLEAVERERHWRRSTATIIRHRRHGGRHASFIGEQRITGRRFEANAV